MSRDELTEEETMALIAHVHLSPKVQDELRLLTEELTDRTALPANRLAKISSGRSSKIPRGSYRQHISEKTRRQLRPFPE